MPITNLCAVCGIPFTSKKYGDHIPKYCSRECSNIGRNKRLLKNCLVCGKEFKAKRYHIKRGQGLCCSIKCGRQQIAAKSSKDYETHFWSKVNILSEDEC